MIVPQAPPLPVFVSVQAVAYADMAAQSLAAVAAIETNHVVMAYRLPDRDRGSQNLCWLNLLSKLAECLMY
jgi:hypothetical protein